MNYMLTEHASDNDLSSERARAFFLSFVSMGRCDCCQCNYGLCFRVQGHVTIAVLFFIFIPSYESAQRLLID